MRGERELRVGVARGGSGQDSKSESLTQIPNQSFLGRDSENQKRPEILVFLNYGIPEIFSKF